MQACEAAVMWLLLTRGHSREQRAARQPRERQEVFWDLRGKEPLSELRVRWRDRWVTGTLPEASLMFAVRRPRPRPQQALPPGCIPTGTSCQRLHVCS